MIKYPSIELTFKQTLWQTIRSHHITLKHVVVYAFLIALTKHLAILVFNTYPDSAVVLNTIKVVFWLLMAAFFSFSIHATNCAFLDKPISFKQNFITVLRRFPKIYRAVFLFALGAVALYYFCEFLMGAVAKLLNDPSSAVHGATLILIVAFLAIYTCALAFFIPLTVLSENKKLSKLISESVLLSEKNKFGVIFSFFILLTLIIVLMPGTKHEAFFARYHVSLLFDFVATCVLFPLFLNFFLLVIHDSQLQLSEEEV